MFPLNCSLSIFQFKRIYTTAESRLHIAMDCGCGSLVKLCGLKGIKFYDPHTSVDRTRRPHQPTSCVAGHPHRRQLWAKYKSNNLRPPVTDKLWVTGSCHAAVCSWPFRQHQKTVLDIIIAVLRRVGLCALVTSCNCCCKFDLCR